MYYWAHTEAVSTAPPTPGRLSTISWPPPMSPNAESYSDHNGKSVTGKLSIFLQNWSAFADFEKSYHKLSYLKYSFQGQFFSECSLTPIQFTNKWLGFDPLTQFEGALEVLKTLKTAKKLKPPFMVVVTKEKKTTDTKFNPNGPMRVPKCSGGGGYIKQPVPCSTCYETDLKCTPPLSDDVRHSVDVYYFTKKIQPKSSYKRERFLHGCQHALSITIQLISLTNEMTLFVLIRLITVKKKKISLIQFNYLNNFRNRLERFL